METVSGTVAAMSPATRSTVSLRRLVSLSPGVTLKMAQVLRRNGRLRPDGYLLADDVLVARALAHSPGRVSTPVLDAQVELLLRRAVAREELAPSTVLLLAGSDSYEASLAVNAEGVSAGLSRGDVVAVLPVGRWWSALRVELPPAAFLLSEHGEVSAVS